MELDDIIREYMWLIRFLVRKKVTAPDVDDVTQNILMAICLNYRSIQIPARTGTWIRSIVRNQIVDYYRKTERSNHLDPESARLFMEPFLEHDPIRTLMSDGSTTDLVAGLAPKYRDVMTMRYLDGKSVREIADQTGIDTTDVSNRLSYARKLLKKHLAGKKDSIK